MYIELRKKPALWLRNDFLHPNWITFLRNEDSEEDGDSKKRKKEKWDTCKYQFITIFG